LKENPVIKEKVIYKENRKELDDLKAECERLRLKLFNYETGHIKVPTHGINVGNLYKVKMLGVGKDGDGFTKVNNFIIFVPNTKKDQITIIKITRVLKKYAFGKILEGEPDGEVIDASTNIENSNDAVNTTESNNVSNSPESTELINNKTETEKSESDSVMLAKKDG
jgi:predicted RNA-binding protein with TRAM domain